MARFAHCIFKKSDKNQTRSSTIAATVCCTQALIVVPAGTNKLCGNVTFTHGWCFWMHAAIQRENDWNLCAARFSLANHYQRSSVPATYTRGLQLRLARVCDARPMVIACRGLSREKWAFFVLVTMQGWNLNSSNSQNYFPGPALMFFRMNWIPNNDLFVFWRTKYFIFRSRKGYCHLKDMGGTI